MKKMGLFVSYPFQAPKTCRIRLKISVVHHFISINLVDFMIFFFFVYSEEILKENFISCYLVNLSHFSNRFKYIFSTQNKVLNYSTCSFCRLVLLALKINNHSTTKYFDLSYFVTEQVTFPSSEVKTHLCF